MSLQKWAENGWLKTHRPSAGETRDLFDLVDRDLRAAEEVSVADWQFNIAYNAGLQLCSILLYACGYQPENARAHLRTIDALPMILGPAHQEDADYFNACRMKRNEMGYVRAGAVNLTAAKELIEHVKSFRPVVLTWLQANHPELLSKPSPGKK